MRRFGRFPVVESSVLVLSLACIVGISVLQQSRSVPVDNSYSTYDASDGGMRVWYELLAREGVRVGRFEERLAFLGRDVGLLVVADPPLSATNATSVGPSDGQALAAWVRDGGHLLVVGSSTFRAVTANDLGLRSPTEKFYATSRAGVSPELRRFGVRTVALEGVEGVRLQLRKHDRSLLGDPRGVIALEYSLGRGRVVQVATGAIFRNAAIARPDRPRLAYGLVALLGGNRGAVAFDESVHGYLTPEHWWQVLPRRFVAAVVLALFVLGVALIGAAIRLGPARPAEPARAPNTVEYLDALASLMERGRAASASLGCAAASTRRLIASRLGGPAEGSASGVAARIANSELRAAFLDLDGLASDLAPTNAELVRGLGIAHRLREEYGTDGRRS